MNHREHGVSLSAEVGVDTEHETHQYTVDTITTQIFRRHGNNRRIVREYSRQGFRQELRVNANR